MRKLEEEELRKADKRKRNRERTQEKNDRKFELESSKLLLQH